MKFSVIIFSVLAILLLCFFFALKKIFNMTFASDRRHSDNFRYVPDAPQYKRLEKELQEHTEKIASEKYEEIYIESYDKLKLFGRFYKRERTDIIKLDFHGYRSHPYRDFAGNNAVNISNGISSILIDQRSHGNSQGNAICFGIKERYDVLSWVNYVIARFGNDTKIILSGVSMGAATVLMAANLDLPENVIGIIADCPYSSPREIIMKVAYDKGLPGKLIFPIIKFSASILAKTDIDETSPVKAAANTDIPVLIIHGDDDKYVPFWMGKKIYDACSSHNKRFLSVKGAGHALAYYCNPASYLKETRDFINSIA